MLPLLFFPKGKKKKKKKTPNLLFSFLQYRLITCYSGKGSSPSTVHLELCVDSFEDLVRTLSNVTGHSFLSDMADPNIIFINTGEKKSRLVQLSESNFHLLQEHLYYGMTYEEVVVRQRKRMIAIAESMDKNREQQAEAARARAEEEEEAEAEAEAEEGQREDTPRVERKRKRKRNAMDVIVVDAVEAEDSSDDERRKKRHVKSQFELVLEQSLRLKTSLLAQKSSECKDLTGRVGALSKELKTKEKELGKLREELSLKEAGKAQKLKEAAVEHSQKFEDARKQLAER